MPGTDPRHRLLPPGLTGSRLSRRRFLAGLGVLAGAGAIAPLLERAVPGGGALETVEVRRAGLGTWIRVVARHHDREHAAAAIGRAYAAIDRVDAQMSIHRADSELSGVNRAAGHATARVDADVARVMEIALDAARRSGGVYDPTVLPLMRLYGFYDSGADAMPNDRAVGRVLDVTGWRQVELNAAGGTLGLARAGAGLDFGSIGKGWAVDQAVAALRRAGIRSGLVDIGGNVYGIGTPDERSPGWSVGVLHPATQQVDHVFVLRDQAVATSANTEQFRILSGVRVGHLFDARRGRPADGHLSASVQAPTGVLSDVMSTAAFVLGPDAFRGWPDALVTHFVG